MRDKRTGPRRLKILLQIIRFAKSNQIVDSFATEITTMPYDKENRLPTSKASAAITTYSYGTNEMKATEQSGSTTTTLIWDGSEYLQGRI